MRHDRTVIVIGGGISGLVAAARLARQGYRVRLLEANGKVGGSCATTTIDGYTFNDGAVFLVLNSVLQRVLEQLDIDPASLCLRRITANSTTWLPDGSRVTHGDGATVAVQDRVQPFAADQAREEIEALVRRWTPLYRALTEEVIVRPPSGARMLAHLWRYVPRLLRPVASELRRSISDAAVRAALAGTVLYSGVPAAGAPGMTLLGLIALVLEGAFLPEGGMGRIPNLIGETLQRAGGEVLLSAPVQRILVANGRVRGVETCNGETLVADAVLSTVGGVATYGRLVEPADAPAAALRMLRRARPSQRALSLQLGLRNHLDAPSYNMNALPFMEEQGLYFETAGQDVRWLSWTVPTGVVPTLARDGGSVVEIFPPIAQDLPASAWTEERKARVAEAALRTLGRYHRLDIAVRRVRGPLEFESQMHLPDGAIYGLSTATSPLAMFTHRSPISGLYLAGQTTFPGYGVAPSAVSGWLAAEAIRSAVS